MNSYTMDHHSENIEQVIKQTTEHLDQQISQTECYLTIFRILIWLPVLMATAITTIT
ncbi:hypothetical protein [Candidatus Sororendozoicomonas aggregata]|uniref:hypothetical protein n=1 Tax=Candidatus Sororendozoicomonas aggregata TaxID=3073239 RepID=UPI002ED1E4EC